MSWGLILKLKDEPLLIFSRREREVVRRAAETLAPLLELPPASEAPPIAP